MIILNLFVVILFSLCSFVCSNFYIAMIRFGPLLNTHEKIIHKVDEYIKEETERLVHLERYIELFKEELSKVPADISIYLGNPINCYTLIKRLSSDYNFIEDKLTKKITLFSTPFNVTFPNRQDLEQAAYAVGRLQVFYNLNTTEIADGLLRTNYSRNREIYTENFTPFSFGDCIQLGLIIMDRNPDYKESIAWFLLAFQLYKAEDEPIWNISEKTILKTIVGGYYKIANDPNIDQISDDIYANIIMWIKKIMDIETNERDLLEWSSLLNAYHKKLMDSRNNKQLEGKIAVKVREKKDIPTEKTELLVYKSLCRGETALPEDVAKRLRCRYLTETHPFLRLAPIKLEQLYIEPDLQMLYDVISDKEIKHLKDTVASKFKWTKPNKSKKEATPPPNYRITKEETLPFNASGTMKRISRRIADFSGLNMVPAEDLQIVNYGIGGYYYPHFDFADPSQQGMEDYLHKRNGGRIATVLFYMSDVAQGGATVFLHLGVTVFPVKGAALMWRNLLPSGEVDHATRHAACPVLRGNKWVSNAWLHTRGQEFLRCKLEYQNSTMPPRLLHQPVLVIKKKENIYQRRRRVHMIIE